MTFTEATMGWYELSKVLHFLGLIALFGFFVVWSRAGGKLRAAATASEARTWLALLDMTRPILPGGAVMLGVSGMAMAALRWRGPYPFMVIGLVALITIWVVWALVGARHLRAMRAAVGESDGPLPAAATRQILDPRPWGVLGLLNGAALGVLFVMTTKLGWLAAVAVVVALAALVGGAFTAGVRRQRDARVSSGPRGVEAHA
ncbi:MAG: hypothetical protein ACJ79A_20445 [Gemmatimonadaceae bacterium]